MSRFRELMESGRRYVYWLDQSVPMQDGGYRVSFVFENEQGHFPTGGGEDDPLKAPWYWNEETCRQKNLALGYTELQAFDIVASSMFQGVGGRRRFA